MQGIRPYQPADLAAVLAVYDSATARSYGFLSPDYRAAERAAIESEFIPHSEVWVAELDGAVAGFMALQGIELNGIFVAGQFQRRGLGRALLEHGLALRGMLDLEVFAANAAGRAFYEHCGFELVYEHLHEASGKPVLRLHLNAADRSQPEAAAAEL